MLKTTLSLSVCIISSGLFAQTTLFGEDFNSGIPATWTLVNADGLTPDPAVAEFTTAWIGFETTVDTCAASTSFYSPEGQSHDYLVTPKLSLVTISKLVWSARSYDASYPDGYLVLISTTDSLAASFTDTLMVVTAEDYYWHTRSIQLDAEGYANQDVYVAFVNNTNNGYILMIDNVLLKGTDFASVEDQEEEVPALLYPNPASDRIRVSRFESGDQLTVCSVDGRVVLHSTEAEINVAGLEPGNYILRINGTTNHYSLPFIKQ